MYNLKERDGNEKLKDNISNKSEQERINELKNYLSNNHSSNKNGLDTKSTNQSHSSYGKNYILKSDFCKTNQFNTNKKKEEQLLLNYYGNMSKELSSSKKSLTMNNSLYEDCSLFATIKAERTLKRNIDITKKKDIKVTTYDEEEEAEENIDKNIEYEDSNNPKLYENEIKRATSIIQNHMTNRLNVFNGNKTTHQIHLKKDISNENNCYYQIMNYNNIHNLYFNQNTLLHLAPNHSNNLYNQWSIYQRIPYNINFQQYPMIILNKNYASYNDETLAQLSPYIIKEQTGCRYIQDKVINNRRFANNLLFPCLTPTLPVLICDQFGNYLFQVLIGILTKENLETMLNLIIPYFYNICISPHGTRVIQKLIERVGLYNTLLQQFNNALQNDFIALSKDPYGNHVIQKYLTIVFYPQNEFLFELMIDNIIEITNSKHGCCVNTEMHK